MGLISTLMARMLEGGRLEKVVILLPQLEDTKEAIWGCSGL